VAPIGEVAAAGNSSSSTGALANSRTIMSVASLDSNLKPSVVSDFRKIEIAASGAEIFSSLSRPKLYGLWANEWPSMAASHVTGCAVLWTETSPPASRHEPVEKATSHGQAAAVPAYANWRRLVQAPCGQALNVPIGYGHKLHVRYTFIRHIRLVHYGLRCIMSVWSPAGP
jgi:subtilisin